MGNPWLKMELNGGEFQIQVADNMLNAKFPWLQWHKL